METLADFQEVVDKGNVIYLQQLIGSPMITSFHNQLDCMRERRDKQKKDNLDPDFKPGAKIAIVLMTNGGNLDEGNALIQEIRALSTVYDVWIVCQTNIFSMGVFLMLSVRAERRVAFSDTRFYCHRSTRNHSQSVSGGHEEHEYISRENVASRRDWANKERRLKAMLLQETALTADEITDLFDKPRYFGVRKAKQIGLISTDLKLTAPVQKKTTTLSRVSTPILRKAA